ncbi:MAG TPA: hypothetical protein ENF95_01545 [Candidatus Aenigmarchaeota archaeon]|nr:hypothetical protein [Candidatus Aenigmarchaeota archaeon]
MSDVLTLALITAIPWIELRGSIPYGIGVGLNPLFVFLLALMLNIALIPLIYFGLEVFYRGFFIKFKLCRKIVESVRKRGEKYVQKYGLWGLMIFVAIPLPGTGAYSGTALAWLLGMKSGKAFLSVALGVTIAGILVTLFSVGIFNFLTFSL